MSQHELKVLVFPLTFASHWWELGGLPYEGVLYTFMPMLMARRRYKSSYVISSGTEKWHICKHDKRLLLSTFFRLFIYFFYFWHIDSKHCMSSEIVSHSFGLMLPLENRSTHRLNLKHVTIRVK